MIRLKKICLTNFLSYANIEYEFKTGQLTIISGNNLDDRDTDTRSCGSGKSGFIEGIYFALIGSSLRGVSVSNLVRKGQSTGTVSLFMEDITNKTSYQIERHLYRNKSSKGKVYKDGEVLPVTTVKDIKETVLGILGLSAEEIQDSFILTKLNYKPFLSLTDSHMRNIVNRLSNISSVDTVFDKLKEKKVGLEDDLRRTDSHYQKIDGAMGMLDSFIEKKKAEANDDRDSARLADTIVRLSSQEKVVEELKKEYEESKEALEDFDMDNESENKKIAQADKVIKLADKKISEATSDARKILGDISTQKNKKTIAKSQVDGAIVCPSCDHEFVLNGDIKNLKKIIKNAGKLIDELNISLDSRESSKETFENALKKASGVRSKLTKAIQEKERIYSRVKQQSNSVNRRLEKEVSNFHDLKSRKILLEEKKENPNDELKKLKTEKIELQEQLNEKEEEMTSTQTKIDGLGEWRVRFTKFKHFLLTKVLDNLNYRINLELSQINPSLSVKLDGFKIDSRGKISEKIDTSVYQHGDYIGQYANFSGGERAEINIATIFARNKMILEKNNAGLDLVAIDEIIESLDPSGVESVAKYLNSQDKTILMITHASTDKVSGVDVTIVEKENEISTIK